MPQKKIIIEARKLPLHTDHHAWSGIYEGEEIEMALEEGEQLVGIVPAGPFPPMWAGRRQFGGSAVITVENREGEYLALIASEAKPDPDDLTDEQFEALMKKLYDAVNDWITVEVPKFDQLKRLNPFSLVDVKVPSAAKRAFLSGWGDQHRRPGRYPEYWDASQKMFEAAQIVRKQRADHAEVCDNIERLEEEIKKHQQNAQEKQPIKLVYKSPTDLVIKQPGAVG